MDQLVQIVGALLILVAFAAAQLGRLDPHSRPYLVLNLLGAAILTVLAWREGQWGFLLLESVWTAVSAWGLLKSRSRPADA
jgi:hypothetical protein